MKLSTETMKVLENFSRINPSIWLKPGQEVTTISNLGSVLATAKIEEFLEYDIPIYDLKSFLQSLSLFTDPEIDVNSDSFLTIKEADGTASCNFHFGSSEFIKTPPITEVTLDDKTLTFTLPQATLAGVIKAGNVFGLKKITIYSEDGKVMFGVTDVDKPDTNTYNAIVGDWPGGEFRLFMNSDNLSLLPGDYDVTIEMTENYLGQFKNTSGNVTYWVSLDDTSKYTK